MIELVLDDTGVEIIGDEVEFVAATIPGLNVNAFIAGNQPAQIGNAQTALPILFHVFGQQRDLGIHQYRERYPDRKSTRLNSSHITISYAVFCLKKKKKK